MKILFLGDYSGFHASLAAELRKEGHDCTVVSDGSLHMDTRRDIDISRETGFINSFRYVAKIFKLLPNLKGYDAVQLINPGFLHLKPGKLRYIFDRIKKQNGRIGLTLAGSDSLFVKTCMEGKIFRYSEFKNGDELTGFSKQNQEIITQWLAPELSEYCKYVYDNINLALSALYEYHKAAEQYFIGKPLEYIGIPVDTDKIEFRPLKAESNRPLNILVGVKSKMADLKGLNQLLAAAKAVEKDFPERCHVEVATDLPLDKYLEKLSQADIVIDQLYSYTPATNALQTMAAGKIAVSGAEREFYDFIGEEKLRPIINVTPDSAKIYQTLSDLVNLPPEHLTKLSYEGREFVEKYNSTQKVTNRFKKAWEKVMV